MSWEDHAACAGMDTDLFFPRENIGGPARGRGVSGEKDRMRQAMQACQRCPVRQECLMFAIEHNEWGVWGGMDTADRRNYARSHDLI